MLRATGNYVLKLKVINLNSTLHEICTFSYWYLKMHPHKNFTFAKTEKVWHSQTQFTIAKVEG